MKISAAKQLSDNDLTAALELAIISERNNVAASIACLIEITARDLHTRRGASSLFVYLTRFMKLSESSASKRCAAVKSIRMYPEMLDLIQSGRLHLSNIALVSRHLTAENSARLIALAQKETQRGLEKVLAMEFPQSAKRDIIRPAVYLSRDAQRTLCGNVQKHDGTRDKPEEKVGEDCAAEARPDFFFESETGSTQPPTAQVPSAVRVHVTLNPEASAALDFLGQAMPGKSASDILSLAICELRKRRETAAGEAGNSKPTKPTKPTKSTKSTKPTKSGSRILAVARVGHNDAEPTEKDDSAGSLLAKRYISTALRREVAQRDGHRCTYVAPADSGPDGTRRCGAIHLLEFDHVTPRAFGGQNSLENLRLLCRAHNNLAAKDFMGKEFIEAHFPRKVRARCSEAEPKNPLLRGKTGPFAALQPVGE